MLMNNLKLLKYLNETDIEETENNYRISLKDVDYDLKHHVVVFIWKNTNSIEFCLSETGDCQENFMQIDMTELIKLRNIILSLNDGEE